MDLWAYTNGIILDFSRRGKPTGMKDSTSPVGFVKLCSSVPLRRMSSDCDTHSSYSWMSRAVIRRRSFLDVTKQEVVGPADLGKVVATPSHYSPWTGGLDERAQECPTYTVSSTGTGGPGHAGHGDHRRGPGVRRVPADRAQSGFFGRTARPWWRMAPGCSRSSRPHTSPGPRSERSAARGCQASSESRPRSTSISPHTGVDWFTACPSTRWRRCHGRRRAWA